MELTELQNIWKKQDEKISESIRLNREILKRIIITKPEKRLRRIKIDAGIRLILPIILIPICINYLSFRNTIDFYLGISLFAGLFIWANIIRLKLFMFANKINLFNSIISTKKEINNFEKYQIKVLRKGIFSLPLAAVGIFLIEMPIMTKDFIMQLLLMVVILVGLYFYKTKHSYSERFRKLDQEIEEIEELEKE